MSECESEFCYVWAYDKFGHLAILMCGICSICQDIWWEYWGFIALVVGLVMLKTNLKILIVISYFICDF